MILYPNAKINLGLNIIEKNADGYHSLQTVFYPIPWTDILEILPSTLQENQITLTGIPIEGRVSTNLCLRACEIMQQDFPQIPYVHIHLHKIIPMQAGLGGGSADAAYTVRMLNSLFDLGLSDANMEDYCLQLGSDCPFFIRNLPAVGRGRGNLLSSIALSLADYYIVVVVPSVGVATAEAYANIRPQQPSIAIEEAILQPIGLWKDLLTNDFEEFVFSRHPLLAACKRQLYQKGAVYASLSGSGSAMFGLFDRPLSEKDLEDFGCPHVWQSQLQ